MKKVIMVMILMLPEVLLAQSFNNVYYHDTTVYSGTVGKGTGKLTVKVNIYNGLSGGLSEIDFHISNGVHLSYRAQSECAKDTNVIACALVLDDNNDYKTFVITRIKGQVYIAIMNPLTNEAEFAISNCKKIIKPAPKKPVKSENYKYDSNMVRNLRVKPLTH